MASIKEDAEAAKMVPVEEDVELAEMSPFVFPMLLSPLATLYVVLSSCLNL